MLFRLLYDEELAHGAYLVGCQRTGEAIVIDPARDVDRYLDEAERQGLRLVAAAETHIHADFLSGARELAEQAGVRLYLSGAGPPDWSYRWLESREAGGRYDHRLLQDGDRFAVGGIEFQVMHTPGHTPEHLAFVVTDRGAGAGIAMGVFTGDCVFVGDMGRPDLLETAAGRSGVKEGEARSLGRSGRKLLALPDFLQIWPAHGAGSACGKALGAVPQSTVGYERTCNEALRLTADEGAFVRFILSGQPEPPFYFGRMKLQNRDGVPRLPELPRPKAAGAARIREMAARETVVVVDTRPWEAFRRGHLPRALQVLAGSELQPVVGSYVRPEDEILLVAPAAEVEAATRALVRIGLDRIIGFVEPEGLREVRDLLVEAPEVSPAELRSVLRSGEPFVLDVRRAAELETGSVHAGALNVAHTRLPERLDALPRDRPLYVHCASGRRSASASSYLRRLGFEAINVRGGLAEWSETGGEGLGSPRGQ